MTKKVYAVMFNDREDYEDSHFYLVASDQEEDGDELAKRILAENSCYDPADEPDFSEDLEMAFEALEDHGYVIQEAEDLPEPIAKHIIDNDLILRVF